MESEQRFLAELYDVQRAARRNRAEAERWLPRLLPLSAPDLRDEVARHPELQPGLTQVLLKVANDTVDRDPARAHELTTAVIKSLGSKMSLPYPEMEWVLQATAWTAHASALRGLGNPLDALGAIAVAADACRQTYSGAWHAALAEVVEAQILHDMGDDAEALRLIRSGAEVILLYGDVERYVQVRMVETLILWEGGERTAAADVWRAMAWEAERRNDALFMAVLENAIALFQLRHGGAEAAACLFEIAHDVFDGRGLMREANRARWGMAEAAAARDRSHDAISEYYKVQALSLADGNLCEAALASVEIIELLLLTGRDREIPLLVDSMLKLFAGPGQEHALMQWGLVQEQMLEGALTPDTLDDVRCFFRNLALQPNALKSRPSPEE